MILLPFQDGQIDDYFIHVEKIFEAMEEYAQQFKRPVEILKGLDNLIDSWQATVDTRKGFEQNNIERENDAAANMWRHKYEGLVTAITTLKRFKAGYAASKGELEQTKK